MALPALIRPNPLMSLPKYGAVSVAPPRALGSPVRVAVIIAVNCIVFFLSLATFTYATYLVYESTCDLLYGTGSVWLIAYLVLWMGTISSLRNVIFSYLGYTGFMRETLRYPTQPIEWPFVSILIPAYNEGETIEPALESLQQLDYPNFEVIVIDDGSKDDTYIKAKRFEDRPFGHGTIRVLTKPNGGKWSAHNFGYQHTRGKLILCLDADSRVDADALKRLVARLTDPEVDIVCGYVRVRNRENILLNCQSLEYVFGNSFSRIPQSHSGTVLCVPGPLGLFRRSVMEEAFQKYGHTLAEGEKPGHYAGPFEGDTFAEDFDLTVAALSANRRVVYEPYAISRTKAPETTMTLINQRYRWSRGTFQVLWKYIKRVVWNREVRHARVMFWLIAAYGFDLITLPLALYQYFCLGVVLYTGLDHHLTLLLVLFLFSKIVHTCNTVLSIMVHNEDWKLLLYTPLMEFYQVFVCTPAVVIGLFDEIRGTSMRW